MNKAATQLTRLFACVSAATLIGCGGSAETKTDFEKVDPTLPVSDWVMVWNDEFDGNIIDGSKWTHEVNCDGGGNQEKQCYTDAPENSFVADGILNIVALPSADTPLPYTSARLSTKYKGDFKYGRFEMRAKLPSGQGSWPAFWMLPTDEIYGGWPKSGEIDILEAVNLKAADADGNPEANVYGTLHYGFAWNDKGATGQPYKLPGDANPADDFHTYALEWQEGEMRWYVDNYLYATQRKSEIRYNSKDEAVGLSHRGWYTEYHDPDTGEMITRWDNAPYDQEFHLLLNLAVGGSWPENVNETGIDAAAFADGQTLAIDYVRVYECASDPETGKGCETVRAGYDKFASDDVPDGALVEGAAPTPPPPPSNDPVPLTIFGDAPNPNWAAWDCCGGSTPGLVTDDERGDVMRFTVGAEPTVNGFISREASITDPNGVASPFDASPLVDLDGYIRFDLKVVSAPNDPTSVWTFKVESDNNASFAEVALNTSLEGLDPVVGEWQTFTFPLSDLSDEGLDPSAIDVIMIFPAWGTGDGAEYLVDNAEITADGLGELPSLMVFTDGQNLDWPMWNCCGDSTPVEAMDDEAHGVVAEFSVGAGESGETVQGFNTRSDVGGGDKPFDGSAILENGVVQFEMKVVSAPDNAAAPWLVKFEADGNSSSLELGIAESSEGADPVTGEWQTYTFPLSALSAGGLDISAIDVIMIFPAWGTSAGVIYRVDNVKIYDPSAPVAVGDTIMLFDDAPAANWVIWDCCGGSTPTVEADDEMHGNVAEFVIGEAPTVMGITTRVGHNGGGAPFDASMTLDDGYVRFDLKVVSSPNNPEAVWTFKIESDEAGTAVELPLTDTVEGVVPPVGEWQTYTFPMQTLFDKGLDISAIDVIMVFPNWGAGEGAVYRLDNIEIGKP